MINSTTRRDGLTPMLPHQRELFDAIQRHSGVNAVFARWAPGVGAHYTGTRIVEATLHDNPNARVLVLCPKAIQEQLRQRLEALSVQAYAGDRYSFRAQQDSTDAAGAVWPPGAAHVLSLEFARQEDIASSLAEVPWDLVLVFEGHRLVGDIRRAVERLLTASPKARLAVFTSARSTVGFDFGPEPRLEFVFTLSDALSAPGYEGRSLPRPRLHEMAVRATQAEADLGVEVAELVYALQRSGSSTSRLTDGVCRQAQSSPAALEDGLRRLRNRLAHGAAAFGSALELDEETSEVASSEDLQAESAEVFSRVTRCLEKLDAVPSDSKLAHLQGLLRHLTSAGSSEPAASIFCRYRATVLYLKVALDDLGLQVHVLHGGLPIEERMATISAFWEQGGVLLASPVLASEGFDFPECDSLILYDMPNNMEIAERLYARFQRIGRKAALNVFSFVPNEAFGPFANQAVQALGLEALFSVGR